MFLSTTAVDFRKDSSLIVLIIENIKYFDVNYGLLLDIQLEIWQIKPHMWTNFISINFQEPSDYVF